MILGAVLVLFALLSFGPKSVFRRERTEHTILGVLAVAAFVFVLSRAGLPWVAAGVVLLLGVVKRFGARRVRDGD